MNRLILALAFLCVASFKFFAAMSDNAFVPAAIMFVGMFGAPQLVWLWFLHKRTINNGQIRAATFTLLAFLFSSVFFGYFPGVSRPTWGREGHFEVPAALLFEVLVTIVGLLIFASREEKPSTGAA